MYLIKCSLCKASGLKNVALTTARIAVKIQIAIEAIMTSKKLMLGFISLEY